MGTENTSHSSSNQESLRAANDAAVAGSGRERAAVAANARAAEAITQLVTLNEQLQHALDSRVVIEQAKGVLAERYSLSVDEAFALLRDAARSTRMGLRALAAAVVSDEGQTPEVVLLALTRPERWSRHHLPSANGNGEPAERRQPAKPSRAASTRPGSVSSL